MSPFRLTAPTHSLAKLLARYVPQNNNFSKIRRAREEKKKYLRASDRLELYNLYLVQISLVLFLYHNGKKTGTTFFSFFCIFPDPLKILKTQRFKIRNMRLFLYQHYQLHTAHLSVRCCPGDPVTASMRKAQRLSRSNSTQPDQAIPQQQQDCQQERDHPPDQAPRRNAFLAALIAIPADDWGRTQGLGG